MQIGSTLERKSERELVLTRTFDAPARVVFDAWTKPAIFSQWWTPKSCGLALLTCDMDVRAGGSYRLAFSHPDAPTPMVFFGRYLEATPPARLVWTNEEAGESGQVTTLTFAGTGGQTRLTMHELYPSKAALDEALASGSAGGMDETFGQLDDLLLTLNVG